MKKTIFIGMLALMLICASAFGAVERVVSTTSATKDGTFTVKYVVSGVSPPFFYSIKDTMSGGCTVNGQNVIATTLTSPATETGAITVKAPSTDSTCTFTGDSKLGSSNTVAFPSASVTIGGGGSGGGSTTTTDSGKSNTWLYVGIGVAAILVLMMVSKKR